jgi:hypothetical protein
MDERVVLARLEDRCNNTRVENQVLILRLNTKLNTLNCKSSVPMTIYLMSVRCVLHVLYVLCVVRRGTL